VLTDYLCQFWRKHDHWVKVLPLNLLSLELIEHILKNLIWVSGRNFDVLHERAYRSIGVSAYFNFPKTTFVNLESEALLALELQNLRTAQITLK